MTVLFDWDDAKSEFPLNVIDVLFERLSLLASDINVYRRGMRLIDPDPCIAMFPEQWNPVQDSKEIGLETGPISHSTLQEYFIQIHTKVSGMDQYKAQRKHISLAKAVRDIVAFDQPLKVALGALSGASAGNKIEYLKSFEALNQVFFSVDEASKSFVNLGALRIKVTTEIR